MMHPKALNSVSVMHYKLAYEHLRFKKISGGCLPVQHAHIQPIYDFRGHLGMGCPAGTLLGLSKAANMGFVWASGHGLPSWYPIGPQ